MSVNEGKIIKNIKEFVSKYNGLLTLNIYEKDQKYYIGFFNDEQWWIELTFSLLNQISGNFDDVNSSELFLDLIILELLKRHYIPYTKEECQITTTFEEQDLNFVYRNKVEALITKGEKKVLFIVGDSKSGKTILVKQFCHEKFNESIGSIYWLDFNRGFYNFNKFIKSLIKTSLSSEYLYVVVDNLECCGFNISEVIFQFLEKLIFKIEKSSQLIIIQDEKYPINKFSLLFDKNNIITLNHEETKRFLFEQDSSFSFFNECKFEKKLLDSKDEDIIGIIFKLLVLNQYDIKMKMKSVEIEKISVIFSNIKIYKDGYVTFSSPSLSKQALMFYKENWKFFEEKFENSFDIEVEKTLQSYLKTSLSITDFNKLICSTVYTKEINCERANFIELLSITEKYLNVIINNINNNDFYCNHLGALLFAAETLALHAEDNWYAMHAWKKVANYLYDTYYIEGQYLPEVMRGKELLDRTKVDFVNDEDSNCIENQIKLQNELLSKVDTQEKAIQELILNEDISILEESNFSFYLSKYQCLEKENKIDMNRFFGTYLLALLFEFEVTAPKNQRNYERIRKLWTKVKENIIDYSSEFSYFYPSRVPWVTARMLLAINQAIQNHIFKGEDSSILTRFKSKLSNYLCLCNIKINYKDKEYQICTPGTGQWNGVLETTIMTTNAILASDSENDSIYGAQEYIKSQMRNCFKNGYIAEGIWAYETIVYKNLTSLSALQIASNLWESLKEYVSNEEKYKNDKSLGETHIAKTLTYLIKKIINSKPNFMEKSLSEIAPQEHKKKVFISFRSESGRLIASSLYDQLLKEYMPYNFDYCMKSGNWPAQLTHAIRQADKFILILSEDVFKSINVLKEIDQIFKFNKEKEIIPVLILEKNQEPKRILQQLLIAFDDLNKELNLYDSKFHHKLKELLDLNLTNMVTIQSNQNITDVFMLIKTYLK